MERDQEAAAGDSATEEEVQGGGGTEPRAVEPLEAEAPGAEQEGQPTAEQLGLMLEDARSKADEHWNKLVRVQAELENLRKRHSRELENAHKFALERFVGELLAVRDSMELGLSAATEGEGADVETLRRGMELTLKLLSDVMAKFNVEQVDPDGEPFDPALHQAMSTQPRSDVPTNTVVAVVQKGYTLNGRLVRPAMVMVSQADSEAGGQDR